MARKLTTLCAVLAIAAAVVPAALADADPASDYLIGKPAFSPYSASPSNATALINFVTGARKAGLPIKVAVIAAPTDLGALTVLYKKPQTYAQFLGQELRYWYHGELLVVMPNGYGIYHFKGGVPAGDQKAIAKLPPPGTNDGNSLITASVKAVEALAAGRGLTIPALEKPHSTASGDRLTIIGVAAVLVALGSGFAFLRSRWRRDAA